MTNNQPPTENNTEGNKQCKLSLKAWLAIFFAPYLFFGIITAGAGLLFLPLGATVGIPLIFSDYPVYQNARLEFIGYLLVSMVLMLFGGTNFKKNWGKFLLILGIYLWALVGMIALGMSA